MALLQVAHLAVVAQRVSGQYCRNIETSLIRPLRPTTIDTRIVFSDQCWFEFTAPGKIEVLLSIEKHASQRDSHNSMERYLLLVAVGFGLESEKDLPLDNFDTDSIWDELYFKKASKINSGFLLLRKANMEVNILLLSDETIIRMEKILRGLVASRSL